MITTDNDTQDATSAVLWSVKGVSIILEHPVFFYDVNSSDLESDKYIFYTTKSGAILTTKD